MKYAVKYLLLKIQHGQTLKKNKELEETKKELLGNNDYLFNENAILKQINKKRYLKYEDKMKFLIKREEKLQNIEQMVANKEDFRKIRKFIKGE